MPVGVNQGEWTFFAGWDSPFFDVAQKDNTSSLVELKKECLALGGVAFNTNGWIKSEVSPQIEWVFWSLEEQKGIFVLTKLLNPEQVKCAQCWKQFLHKKCVTVLEMYVSVETNGSQFRRLGHVDFTKVESLLLVIKFFDIFIRAEIQVDFKSCCCGFQVKKLISHICYHSGLPEHRSWILTCTRTHSTSY